MLQAELEELVGVPLEDLLNEHQLRCSTMAESGVPLLLQAVQLCMPCLFVAGTQ